MSWIEIDDDDDDIVEEGVAVKSQPKELTKQDQAKQIIKLGLEDAKDIVVLLEKIEKIIEPFGDLDTILELKTLYNEVIPDLLMGNYSEILGVLPEDAKEVAMVVAKQRRKNIFENLLEKYSE